MLEQGESVCNVRGEGQDCTVCVCVFECEHMPTPHPLEVLLSPLK